MAWRYTDRPNSFGKYGKVPYSVEDRRADYTNPYTWLPFGMAVQQYARGDYDGIGIVLGEGLCGLDEDHCVSHDGEIEPEAARHIQHLNSYTERSLSGGIHCLAYGSLPPSGRRYGNHELYSEARFFVVTGWHVPGTPTDVAHRKRELHEIHSMIFPTPNFGTPVDAAASVPKLPPNTQRGEGEYSFKLSDQKVIELILVDKVACRYWEGCPAGVNPSEADFALALKLAFYTGKRIEQMYRLFKLSGLAKRAKANSRRGTIDYAQYTLQRACSAQNAIWRPRQTANAADAVCPRPGRPKGQVNSHAVHELRIAGKSFREIGRALGIGKTTAARLFALAVTQQNAPQRVPKMSQNSPQGGACAEYVPDLSERSGGVPYAEWKAGELNRLFLEQGLTGHLGRITADTVRHGNIDQRRLDRRSSGTLPSYANIHY